MCALPAVGLSVIFSFHARRTHGSLFSTCSTSQEVPCLVVLIRPSVSSMHALSSFSFGHRIYMRRASSRLCTATFSFRRPRYQAIPIEAKAKKRLIKGRGRLRRGEGDDCWWTSLRLLSGRKRESGSHGLYYARLKTKKFAEFHVFHSSLQSTPPISSFVHCPLRPHAHDDFSGAGIPTFDRLPDLGRPLHFSSLTSRCGENRRLKN